MYLAPAPARKLILTLEQMIKNDHDLLNSIFDAAEYLSGIVARYTSIAIHYRDRNFTDSDELQNVMIEVYVAILSYSAAVADAQNVNFASRTCFCVQIDYSLILGRQSACWRASHHWRANHLQSWNQILVARMRLFGNGPNSLSICVGEMLQQLWKFCLRKHRSKIRSGRTLE